MTVLSRAQATAAAAVPAFQTRVRSAIVDVAVDIHDGTGGYTQSKYDARAALAAAVLKNPYGYTSVFALAVASNEFTPGGDTYSVPGAGDGTDPLVDTSDGDASLRAGVRYVWDAVAATPETV